MNWETVSIFISSTFNDMHAERDYLIKYVFPELAEWCEKRRIRLVDIDLRWGVTADDAQNKHVIRKCLENIDDCRPFFLCLIGQRRGWVPNDPVRAGGLNEVSAETINEYPQVAGYIGKKSVTEVEIEHALLAPMYRWIQDSREEMPAPCNAVFFERMDPFASLPVEIFTALHRKIYTNDDVADWGGDPRDADKALGELKKEINGTLGKIGKQGIIPYTCSWDGKARTPELLREKINGREIINGVRVGDILKDGRLVGFKARDKNGGLADFKSVIIEALQDAILGAGKFKDRKEPFVSHLDRYGADKEQQELFVQIATEGYIHRSDIEQGLNDYISGESGKAMLLTAEAGLGKTTLLAHYVKPGNNGSLFDETEGIYRFCGVSDLTTDSYTLWDGICRQAGVEMPESCEKLRQNILSLLAAIAAKGHRHIVIDAINQMTDGENMLYWLPEALPPGLKLILSIKLTDENKSEIARHDGKFINFPVNKLADFGVKKSLIEQFLKRYLKAFDEGQIREICGGIDSRVRSNLHYSPTCRWTPPSWERRHPARKTHLGRRIGPRSRHAASGANSNANSNASWNASWNEWMGEKTMRVRFPVEHHTDNPLFLKVLLHELRFFGSFTRLPDEIKNYGSSPREAFAGMLRRLEKEDNAYVSIASADSVPFIFGLLSQARNGLSEAEMLDCFIQKFPGKSTEQILGVIRFYFRQTRPFMARKDGRADFLYDEFKIAAREKYPANLHLVLAMSLFGTRPSECAYHARRAANREYLEKIYTDLDFLNRYYEKDGAVNLLNEARQLEAGVIPAEIQKFIDETAALLAKNPSAAPETFYKELPLAYKAKAAALCKNPWIKMDGAALPIELTRTRTVGARAIQPLDIRSGHVAGDSGEAFFLVSADEVQVVDTGALQTVSRFKVAAGGEIENIFVSPKGDLLAAAMRDGFSIFHLRRDTNRVVISSELKLGRKCRRIRLGSACVFVAGNKLIYQTPENSLFAITLDPALDEIPLSKTSDANIQEDCPDCPLCGYYLVDNTRYYVFKKSGGQYCIRASAGGVLLRHELADNVYDMLAFNGRMVILADNKMLVFTDPLMRSASILGCDFVPGSGALFGDSLLLASKHGQLCLLGADGAIKDYGMLSVGRWDIKSRIHAVGDKKAFFFSDHRYALIGETLKENYTIMKSRISRGSCEILFVDKDNCLRLKTREADRIISKDMLQHLPYGLTSLMNYRCDWNGAGAVLRQGDGITAEMTAASGRRILIEPPGIRSAVFDIQFLNKLNVFVILYQDGMIRLVDGNGETRDAETFKSSSRNYLLCDCGDYFGVVAKRRLVQQATLLEETALALHDKKGRMVFEDHYNGLKERPIDGIVYDSVENKACVITRQEAICYDLGGNFSSRRTVFEAPFIADFCGLSASNGLLYHQRQEQGLCVVDLHSGRLIARLPAHRSISNISPCPSGTAVVENNEIIYETKLNRRE